MSVCRLGGKVILVFGVRYRNMVNSELQGKIQITNYIKRMHFTLKNHFQPYLFLMLHFSVQNRHFQEFHI